MTKDHSAPRVSVVIPAFNMERYLDATLDSLQRQTYTSFEVLVVDDCSTDKTPEIVKRRAEGDARFRYVRTAANSNRPAVPRNRGIAESRGEFIAFLDHDDLWSARKLERQILVLDARPDIALVHSHLWDFTARSKLWGLIFLPNPYRRRADFAVLQQRNVVQCSSAIARADVLRELGGFDERPELRAVEDYHMWLRIAERHKIAYISEVHGGYRWRPMSTSNQSSLTEKHRYLDEVEGTELVSSARSAALRLLPKMAGYPLAIYFHLLEGSARQAWHLSPRVFEVDQS